MPVSQKAGAVISQSSSVESYPTIVWAPFGLTACLGLAEKYFESENWKPRLHQMPFMEDIFAPASQVVGRIPESLLRSIAAKSADEINAFLKEHGSGKIKLAPFQDEASVGFASVTKAPLVWSVAGTRTKLTRGDTSFAAAKLKDKLSFERSEGAETLVKIEGEEGYAAYMTPMTSELAGRTKNVVALASLCRHLTAAAQPLRADYESVVFPMIDLEYQPDLSWLLELELVTREQVMFVRQAVQLIAFKMNHLGAAFRDEVAIEMAKRCLAPPSFVIDRPFLFWITRQDLEGMPMFSAVLSEDVWRDPGDDINF